MSATPVPAPTQLNWISGMWIAAAGYEISFTRYFYKSQPLGSLATIRADIVAVEKKTEGLLAQILGTEN